MDNEALVALEIGTTTVRTAVGIPAEDGTMDVIGYGESASSGVRKSEVVHMENAVTCVRGALRVAEETGDIKIGSVHMAISGGHIQSRIHRGTIPLLDDHEITEVEKEHVCDTAGAVSLSGEREIIHTLAQNYYIDDHSGVINPLGMMGARLSVDVMLLHGVRSRMRNVIKVARDIPLDVPDVAFAGLCAALAVLSVDEKHNGALVIDLGGGTTTYQVYADSVMAASGAFGVGGDHITNDLARGLRLTLSQAEQLKETYGSALIDRAARALKLDVPPDAIGAQPRQVRKGDIQLITSARAEEIFQLVKATLDQLNLGPQLGSGVVLTGAGARLHGAASLASSVFGLPCRIGSPIGCTGILELNAGPEHATILGLLRYAQKSSGGGNSGNKPRWRWPWKRGGVA